VANRVVVVTFMAATSKCYSVLHATKKHYDKYLQLVEGSTSFYQTKTFSCFCLYQRPSFYPKRPKCQSNKKFGLL